MEITVDLLELKLAVKTILKVAPSKETTADAPTGVRLRVDAKKGRVELAAKNAGLAVVSRVLLANVKGGENFETVVNARDLANYVAFLPETSEPVTLSFFKSKVKLSVNGSQADFSTTSAEEFPDVSDGDAPRFMTGLTMPFQSEELEEALRHTVYAVAKGGMIPAAEAVCFQFREKDVAIWAADGYRAVRRILPYADGGAPIEPFDVLVPGRALQEARSLVSKGSMEIDLMLDAEMKQALLRVSLVDVVIPLLPEMKYPPLETAIAPEYPVILAANREALLSAVQQAGLFGKSAKLAWVDGIELRARDSQRGGMAQRVDAEVTGEPGFIVLNMDYLREALESLKDEETVVLKIVNNTTPIALAAKDRDDYLALLWLVNPALGEKL